MTIRLFVALDLPREARSALARFRDAAADPAVWRPVADEALHITLAFLGHRPDDDIATAASVLERLPAAAPRLALAGALRLPPRRARVLCAGVQDPDGDLATLQAIASDALAGAEIFTPERRPFRPHVTVARLRSGARPPATVGAEPEPLSFAGKAVTLYRSRLERTGARYEPLARRGLTA